MSFLIYEIANLQAFRSCCYSTHILLVNNHTISVQVVSALAVDHTGSRVLSGSYDYTVRMYDFQGMNSKLQSFRQLEPFEGHQVRSLSWSPTSDRFLCVTGSAQAKVFLLL